MQTSIAKRIFAVGTSMAMLLTGFAFTASAAAHGAGTNVVSNGTVYWINSAGQKQAYTSAGAFLSYGFNSWSNVVPASTEDLALPNGSYVPPMDGSLINDKGTVYLMTNGQRAGFTSAANFTGLGYSFKNVIAGDTSFLPSAANISSTAMAHPVGTLVNDNGTVYLMTASGKMGIPSLSVFNSWGYSFAHVVPANSYDTATPMSSGIMQARATGQLNPTGSTSTVTPPVSGGVNVSVDNLTPAAGSIAKSAKVTFTKLDFTAGSQAATVSSLVVTRIGLSSDSDVSNVYLFDTATNTQLSVGSFNNGRVTFTGSPLFTVNANSMKTVDVRADMASGGTTGDSIGYGIASAADVNVGGATVGGTFPTNGNLMTIAAVSNLGAVTITSPSNLSSTINPGTQGATIGYFQLAGSNQPLSVTYLKLTNVGSVAQADIQNIKLYNGSTQVGTTQQQAADKTVTFDLSSSPLIIPSGNTVNLYVKGDVMGGSNRTFQFTIQRTSDILATDTTYNTGIVPGLGSATGTSPVPSSTTNQVTVNAGTATMQVSMTSPTGNIPTGATSVTLSTFNFTATGEDVRVSALTVSTTTTGANLATGTNGATTDYLKNGKLVDVTGGGSVQVGSTANLNINTATSGGTVTTTYTLPGYWTIPAGTTRTLAIVADTNANLATSTQLNAGTIHADITSVTAQGATSLSTVTFGTATGRTLTFTSGSLTAAVNAALANTQAVKGQTGVRVASFQITAGTAEGANVTQLQLTSSATAGGDYQNLKVMVGSTQIGATTGTVANSTIYSFSPSTQLTIPVGGSIVVDVYADVLTSATAGSRNTFNLTGITATGTVDNQALTATGTPVTGQTVNVNANGALTVSADAQAPTAAQLQQLPMGATQQTLAVFNFAASNVENINVTAVTVTDTETSGAQGDLQNFKLYVNGVQVGPTVPSESGTGTTGTVTFNMQTSPLVVPQNSNVSVYVKADISPSPIAVSNNQHNLNLASSGVTSLGAVSGASGGTSAAVTGVNAKVYKTTLTVAKDSTSPSGLSSASATQTIGVYNVTNASNSANAQATFMPSCATSGASTNELSVTLSTTIAPSASHAANLKIFKSTDLTTAIAAVTLTQAATGMPATWSGTLQWGCTAGSAQTATWTQVGTGTAPTVSAATWTPQVINAGQTVQYVVQFDTTDAVAQKSMTLSIPSSQGNVWYDSASVVTTLMGAPVTFGTLTY